MSRLIDADALEKDGWMMHRTVRVDKDTMSYETKKPTDFPTIEPERKKGKWTLLPNGDAICQECKHVQKSAWDMDGWDNFCHHCGADMREEGEQK